MSFKHFLRSSLCVTAVAAVLWLFLSVPVAAQFTELIIDVGDTNAVSGQLGVRIPVYMSNFTDTVVGFDLWIQMDRPDIAQFALTDVAVVDTNYWQCSVWYGDSCGDSILVDDTTYWQCLDWQEELCVDSVMVPEDSNWDFIHTGEWDWYTIDTNVVMGGAIDTAGTLISGWELVSTQSLGAYGFDLKIVGLADLFPPPVTPGIYVQEGGVLFYLVLNVFDIPDTLTERTVTLRILDTPSNICFTDNLGNCIGIMPEQVVDSNCFVCNAWSGDDCLDWMQTIWYPGGIGCDSIAVDTSYVPVVDTMALIIRNGSLSIDVEGIYGDFNDDGSVLDISDLVYLVSYMFAGGPPPFYIWTADCDYNGDIDIADLVCWVTTMFPTE
ncbi:MAG TPA: hypothetical protein PLF13_13740 [candidate division Zixibacteria bacterium]|nr:hypothetical protein [candidate division Zixibacteria bacterium]